MRDAFGCRWRRAAVLLLAVPAICLSSSCTSLNPSFLGLLGQSPAAAADAGTGYVAVLVMDTTPNRVDVVVRVKTVSGNDETKHLWCWPADYNAATFPCEVQEVEVLSMTYTNVDTDGSTEEVELDVTGGLFVTGVNLQCGQVVAITATGTPPAIFVDIQTY